MWVVFMNPLQLHERIKAYKHVSESITFEKQVEVPTHS
jgi:hypothetical protein